MLVAVIVVIAAFILAIMAALSVAIFRFMPLPHNAGFPTTQADWTLFADLLGSIGGTFFAGLAFAGLIWTIRIQQRELRETREELAKAAKAQVESQKAHEAHVKVAQQAARLSAATALLNHYQALMPRLIVDSQPGMGGGASVRARLDEVQKAVGELETEIQTLRDELKALVHRVEIHAEIPAFEGSLTVQAD